VCREKLQNQCRNLPWSSLPDLRPKKLVMLTMNIVWSNCLPKCFTYQIVVNYF
jgi:hypothetical protein